MRRIRFVSIAFLIGLLAACASPPARDGYQAYLEFVSAQSAREDARLAGIAAAAQSCTDARCVEHVAAVAALASMRPGGAGSSAAPPQRAPTGAEQFARVASALAPIAGTLITGAVQWHQSDTARDVSVAQYAAIDHIVSGAVGGMADVSRSAVPSITVGGDYVSGTQTQAGRDYITGNPVTVGGDLVGRDQYRGPVAGGNQRWNSPGPVGDGCQGEGCQPQQPPPVP